MHTLHSIFYTLYFMYLAYNMYNMLFSLEGPKGQPAWAILQQDFRLVSWISVLIIL